MITDRFYYHQLNANDKNLYKKLYDGIRHYKESITVDEFMITDFNHISRILLDIELDNPFLYYYNITDGHNYWLNDAKQITHVNISYYCAKEEADAINRGIEKAGNQIIHDLGISQKTALEKVAAIHDYMCRTINYQHSAIQQNDLEHNFSGHTIFGIFAKHKSVCDGISKAAKFLLNCLDVPCIIVHGYGGDEIGKIDPLPINHAWNIVRYGEQAYNLDITWDINQSTESFVCQNYLNIPDSLFYKDHQTDTSVPACTSDDEYYFIKNSCDFQNRNDTANYILSSLKANKKRLYFRLAEQTPAAEIDEWVNNTVFQIQEALGRKPLIIEKSFNQVLNVFRLDLA